jgi:hypothetical protein
VYNCIYDTGEVVSLEQGPCQEVLDTGAVLVDASYSGEEITVTTPAPTNGGLAVLMILGAALFIGGFHRVR